MPDRPPAVGLRIELFADDLDAMMSFYADRLAFEVVRDERATGYVALRRDVVEIGIAHRDGPFDPTLRRPPTGIEIVLEVADVVAERDALVAAGVTLADDLELRPWGLRDVRLLDPAGHYLRLTERA